MKPLKKSILDYSVKVSQDLKVISCYVKFPGAERLEKEAVNSIVTLSLY